jgi:hypothetical protein
MSSIVIQGDTSGSITVEAPSVAGTHTLTLPKATGTVATNATVGLGTKNRIINGDMRIAQRIRTQNASVVSTITQSTTAPTGFINSFYLSIGTGAASGSTDRAQLYHGLEGLNVSDFGWGTANAKTVTLSFWVRSSLTGQFGGAIQNSAGNRSYPFTYTISSANTWEQKTVTVAGDTTGTWTTDNGLGIQLNFDLGAGSSFLTTAGSWAAGDYRGATGDTSIVATSGATWYITGIQLEASTEATPFENRMYSTELAMCQRYFYQIDYSGSQTFIGSGLWDSTTNGRVHVPFKTTMRATPTLSSSASSGNLGIAESGTAMRASTSSAILYANNQNALTRINVASSGATIGEGTLAYLTGTGAYIYFNAEL